MVCDTFIYLIYKAYPVYKLVFHAKRLYWNTFRCAYGKFWNSM